MAVKKNNITFHPCQIGLKSSPGYIVKYKGGLIAILNEDKSSGDVYLSEGLEHPYICTFCSWDSINDAREEFLLMGKLYDTPEAPEDIERAWRTFHEKGVATIGNIHLVSQD